MAEALAVGSGLARGFANVLLSKRQKDQEDAVRKDMQQQQLKMALLSKGIEDGQDPNVLIPALGIDLHFGEKPQKGQPNHNEMLAHFLSPTGSGLQPATEGAQKADVVGSMNATANGELPSSTLVSPAAPAAAPASTGPIPFFTPEQMAGHAASKAAAIESATKAAEIQIKQDAAVRLFRTGGAKTMGEALDRVGLAAPYQSALRGQSVAGQMPDGTSKFGVFEPGLGKYIDPDTGQPLVGFQPRTTTGSTSLGADATRIATELGYGDIKLLKDPAKMAHVNAVLLQRQGQLKVSQALQAANQMIPNATAEEKADLADGLMKGSTTAMIPAGAPSPTETPATGAPATPKLSSAIPETLKSGTKQTGAPLPPQVVRVLAQAKATTDLIDQALKALEPFKDDSSLTGSLNLARNYRMGVYDPISGAAAQLADLAGLQSTASQSLTSGGSRAYQFYVDRKQHVPRLPSGRQTMMALGGLVSGDTVQKASILKEGDAGGFDSPKAMYEKLLRAKANTLNFVNEVENTSNETKSGKATKPAATGAVIRDGKLYINGTLVGSP